ncbi:cupin domain-containing protein [soil metagenome]
MTITFHADAVPATDLSERLLVPPSAEPLDGDVTVRSRVEFTTDDKKIISGIWECDPGASRWNFVDHGEIIQVISGRMTVQQDGEEATELTAGSSAYFPIGWSGVWTVTETLRKVYVVYKP